MNAFWLVTPLGIRAVPRDTHQTYATLAKARAVRNAQTPTKPHYKFDAGAVALYRLRRSEGYAIEDAAGVYARALTFGGDSWAWRRGDALAWAATTEGIDAILAQYRARIIADCERIAAEIASVGWVTTYSTPSPDSPGFYARAVATNKIIARDPRRTRDW